MESLLILPTLHSLNSSTYNQQPIFDFSNNSSIFSSSSVKTMSERDVDLVEEALIKLPNIRTRSQRLFWPFLGDDYIRQKERKVEERKRTGRQRCSIDRPQFCRRRGNNNVRNLT